MTDCERWMYVRAEVERWVNESGPERADLLLDAACKRAAKAEETVACRDALIATTVSRLGGWLKETYPSGRVVNVPVSRVNFLQRIAQLRAIEAIAKVQDGQVAASEGERAKLMDDYVNANGGDLSMALGDACSTIYALRERLSALESDGQRQAEEVGHD